MSIQAIAGMSPGLTAVSGTPMTMTSPPPTPALYGTLSGIAKQLGMTVGETQSALGQGATVSQLAAQQGVNVGSLSENVQSQIQQTRQASGQPPLDPPVLDRLVNRAFNGGRSTTDPTPASSPTTPAASTVSGFSLYV